MKTVVLVLIVWFVAWPLGFMAAETGWKPAADAAPVPPTHPYRDKGTRTFAVPSPCAGIRSVSVTAVLLNGGVQLLVACENAFGRGLVVSVPFDRAFPP